VDYIPELVPYLLGETDGNKSEGEDDNKKDREGVNDNQPFYFAGFVLRHEYSLVRLGEIPVPAIPKQLVLLK